MAFGVAFALALSAGRSRFDPIQFLLARPPTTTSRLDGVNFEFSDDQRLLRDQDRRFSDNNASPHVARAILDDEALAYDADLWRSLAELGWTWAIVPEGYSGAGMIREDL